MTSTTLRILGLSPLAIMASSIATGAALGIAILVVSSVMVLLLSTDWLPEEPLIRYPAILLVAAASTTIFQLLCKAFLFEFYAVNGGVLALAIASGVMTGALATVPAKTPARVALMESLRHGAGMALILTLVGGLRWLSGAGFAGVPAGAFFSLALLIAMRASLAGR